MNREVLINSLEEFMSETDARLTTLEAAKPQATDLVAEIHRLEMDVYRAEGDLVEAEAEIERLIAERDGFELAYQNAAKERNTLAAQVDDLRNINAGLRNENARLKSSVVATVNEINGDLAAENARLRTENDVLRRDYGIKRRQYDEVQASLKALQDDLR